jgi:hypothetical protein
MAKKWRNRKRKANQDRTDSRPCGVYFSFFGFWFLVWCSVEGKIGGEDFIGNDYAP